MNEQSGPSGGTSTEAPSPAPHPTDGPRVTGDQMRDVDRLRRSTSDRYLAGVAGGLGRHFDIDPTVVRVLIAVLTLFGGAGILLYAAVWILVPEDGRDRAVVDVNADVRRVVLVAAAAVSLMIVFGSPFVDNSWGWVFPLPLLVIAVVVVAVVGNRQRRTRPTGPPPPWGSALSPTPTAGAAMTSPMTGPTTSTSVAEAGTRPVGDYPTAPSYGANPPGGGQAPPTWMPPPSPAYVPPPRPRRTGLVLFWPTLALVAIGLGTLGIFDVNDTIPVSAYAALALTVVAVMLLVGAFVGRPGGLIALGLLASVGLGITSAVDAATGGNATTRDTTVVPLSAASVRTDYSLPNGSLVLDLRQVRDPQSLDGQVVAVHLNAGQVRVILPPGTNAEVDAEIRYAGSITIDGSTREGLNPALNRAVTQSAAPGTPTLSLLIDARVGDISVETN